MTLPSNSSMHAFPDNTLTTYTTLLAEYVTSAIPLECALQEITCPTSWYNIEEETLVVIQGAKSPSQPKSSATIKRLQWHLNKKGQHFFHHSNNKSPVFSRPYRSQNATLAKRTLRRGVKLTRTEYMRGTTPRTLSKSSTTAAPSGVAQLNQAETLSEVEEEESAAEEEEEVEKTSVSAAVAAVRAATATPDEDTEVATVEVDSTIRLQNYHEVVTFTSPSGTNGLTTPEILTVKTDLNIKELDKLVETFQFRGRREYTVFMLEGVYLKDNVDFIGYLNRIFNRRNPRILAALQRSTKNGRVAVFSYSRYTMKCTINLPPDIILKIPDNLGLQLGFGGGIFLTGKTEGEAVVDLKFRAQTVYVYSDIVKHSIVGDKRAPLLRVVAINPLQGDTQTVTFQPMIYQPVCKATFKEITMYLRDSTGRHIPFERGLVTAVLAFRPIRSL